MITDERTATGINIFGYDQISEIRGGTVFASGGNRGIFCDEAVLEGSASVEATGEQLVGIHADLVAVRGSAQLKAEGKKYAISAQQSRGGISLGPDHYIASPPGGIISVPADRGESNDTVFVAVSNRYYSTPATFAVIKSRVSGAATQPDEEEKKKEEETILTPVDQKDAASLKEPSGSKGISGTTVDALPQSGSIGKVNASDFSITGNFTKKRLTIRFQKVSGATNYVIAWKKAAAKSWNYATCGNTDRFVIRGVKRGSLLDIRICAYVHGSRGPWSNIYRCFFEKASASASRKGTRLTVTFKKTKGASGYELQWATNKRMKGYKTKSVKNGQRIVLSKLKRSGKYYIRWRPYKRYRAKKYLGLYSSVKKV